ncbi:MAG TPA: DUF6168 family protein [Flavobacteriaceae bacterium]|nr:DUF6168 family protein [Flavobacteriaceae bacterium]
MRRKQFLSSLGLLSGVTIILFVIHSFVIETLSDEYYFDYPVWSIYAFHFFVTALIFGLLSWVGRNMPYYVGYTFMGTILFKMIFALIFLLPLIQTTEFPRKPDFFSFFIPYFIFLLLEIVLTMRILEANQSRF